MGVFRHIYELRYGSLDQEVRFGQKKETVLLIFMFFYELLSKFGFIRSYTTFTARSYTNVKLSLMHAGVDPLTLAAMDSGFMFTYAGGSFVTGQLGDHFSPVAVVAGGLLGSTVCLFLILIGASTSIIDSAAVCSTWFLGCQLLHGLFQATGGPVRIFLLAELCRHQFMLKCFKFSTRLQVNTAIMSSWFSKKGRGLVFGKLLYSL
jgi:MFS family permease